METQIKHRYKVNIDTQKDAIDFVQAINGVEGRITLEDGTGLCVSAHSIIGVLYTMEFSKIYCYSEQPISHLIKKWISEE